jgi:hypothetical protein
VDDVAAAIRGRIERRPDIFPGMARGGASHLRYKGWSDQMAAALLAVLELHRPFHRMSTYCSACWPGTQERSLYPCPTVRAVAKALGLEVADDA